MQLRNNKREESKNVLLVYTYISHYRIPLFERLGQEYNLTVIHSGKKMSNNKSSFKEIVSPAYHFGKFRYQPKLIHEYFKGNYDVVILFLDVAWISTLRIAFARHHKKPLMINWGAWMTRNPIANRVRSAIINRSDASLFYAARARSQFKNKKCKSRLIVATNTIEVKESAAANKSPTINTILSVGSLDSRKKPEMLIKAFKSKIDVIPLNIKLVFIGAGSELNRLKDLVKNHRMEDRILFLGAITDSKTLAEHYSRAIICTSYGQAGLSVLQSFGNGVAYLTNHNAISGFEIDNIQNGRTGILTQDFDSFSNAIEKCCNSKDYALTLGRNARSHYLKYATMDNMAQAFIDAIEGTDCTSVFETPHN